MPPIRSRVHLRTILIAIALLAVVLAYVAIPLWREYTLSPIQRKQRDILAKLEQPLDMPFAGGAPLVAVLKHIKAATSGPKDSGIPIYVDPVGLQEAQASMSAPIKVTSKGAPLKMSLRQALEPLGLSYYVDKGLLTITSKQGVERASKDATKSGSDQ